MTSDFSAALQLQQAASNDRVQTERAPHDFRPGVVADQLGRPTQITTPAIPGDKLEGDDAFRKAVDDMGAGLPDGYSLALVEARYDPVAWTRDDPDQKAAVTKPAWRYRFRVVADPLGVNDADLDTLHKMARKAAKARPKPAKALLATYVIVLADLQIGKVDHRGGTAELLERLEVAKLAHVAKVRALRPAQIVIVDAGDILEGFESAPNADRMNDLGQVEQVRVARRIMFDWVSSFAKLTEDLRVVAVPSNHCRVRRGKNAMGAPDDDWGIETMHAVADICSANPEAFGHVQFHMPSKFEEAVGLVLTGGKVLGVAHGHQRNSPERLGDLVAKHSLGRTDFGQADFVVFGHFHAYRLWNLVGDVWAMVAPTSDSGSSWFGNLAGGDGPAGVASIVIDEHGWRDPYIAWA